MDKHLEDIEKDDLILLISKEFGLPVNAITPEIFEELIRFLKENGASVKTEKVISGGGPPGTLGMLISKTHYFINVKTSLWIAMGFLADVLVTRGAVSTALVATGKTRQCLGKLDARHGEICVYRELYATLKGGQGLTTNDLFNKLAGKECYEEFFCEYRNNEKHRCGITSKVIDKNLKRMKEIGAVNNKREYWRAEL